MRGGAKWKGEVILGGFAILQPERERDMKDTYCPLEGLLFVLLHHESEEDGGGGNDSDCTPGMRCKETSITESHL